MRRLTILALLLISAGVSAQDTPPAPPGPPAPPAAARATLQRRELSLRQRRELGLTISNLVAVAKELRAEGEIDDSMSRAEKSAAVLIRLHDKNPQAFSEIEADADRFDAIFEFIERLWGLIEKIMGRFQ